MPHDKPKKRNLLGTFIIASIAYIVLGVFMVVKSQAFADVINVIFGVAMLIYGIINIVAFFLNKDSEENLFMELAMGVIAVGLGIFSLVASTEVAKILFYCIGGVLIVDGLVNVKRAFNLKAMGFTRWNVMLIIAAIGIIMGILCVILYASMERVVVAFIGVSLIYEGLAGLITILIDARIRKKVSGELARMERNRPID